MGRWPLKMTRSKQESTATINPVNLAARRDSVFMASSSGWEPQQTPFWREDAVFAHPLWLRLRRVRMGNRKAREFMMQTERRTPRSVGRLTIIAIRFRDRALRRTER